MNEKCEDCIFMRLCKVAELEYCEGESYYKDENTSYEIVLE